jgi:cytochrome c
LGNKASSVVLATIVALGAAPVLAQDNEIDVPEVAEACVSCHAFGPGEPALEGPTLWGVVGRPIASVQGFDYSAALRKLDGDWTPERLDRFLTSPQSYAPGTLMTLGGVKDAGDRKRVIAFLESLRPVPAQ